MTESRQSFNPDEWVDQFLEHSRIQGLENVFVLGCFERRRVTVGAQQVRAVNLVEALVRRKILSNSLLVIGAGAGGLTAAAYAAFRGIKEVHVVEEQAEPLTTFKDSSRLLHPRLYEWPFDPQWQKPQVDLPLMNWDAGEARIVATKLRADWDSWCELYGIKFHPNIRLQGFDGDKFVFELSGGVDLPNAVDATILAVGFGKERNPGGISSPRYWENDDLDTAIGSILVCGNGDGALTDLFRARVLGFKQQLLQEFLEATADTKSLTEQAHAIEKTYESGQVAARDDWMLQYDAIRTRAKSYEDLVTEEMVSFIESRLRKDTTVTLFVRRSREIPDDVWRADVDEVRSVFTLAPQCFPLNRLFANAIFRADLRQPNRALRFEFSEAEQELPENHQCFDRIYFRGGTNAAIKPIVPDEEAERLREVIQDSEKGEVTRFPLWDYIDASPFAFVPWTEGTGVVAEIYKRIPKLVTYTDLLDSVAQAKLFDAVKPESLVTATHHFRGVLRLLALFYDEIVLVDVQVFDGQFFVKWRHELQDESLRLEYDVYRSKLCISTRTGDLRPYQGFFLHPDQSVKTFEPSAFPADVRRAFLQWQSQPDIRKRAWKNLWEYFGAFTGDHDIYKEVVDEVAAAWRLIETERPFRVRNWGRRNLDVQFEDPGRFHAGLSRGAKDLLNHIWPQRPNRTVVWDILRRSRTSDARLNHEIDKIQAWYNRAYNRANAKQNDCNVFTSLHGGETPLQAEPADRVFEAKPIDFSGLGRIPSEEYLRFVDRFDGDLAKQRQSGNLRLKLEILHRLAEVAGGGTPETVDELTDAWTRKILESLKLNDFEQLWIGSREAGPDKGYRVIENGRTVSGEQNNVTEVSAPS